MKETLAHFLSHRRNFSNPYSTMSFRTWISDGSRIHRRLSSPGQEFPDRKDQFHVLLRIGRSEEHTSELQSRFDLVCRLLLEKKNLYINMFLYYILLFKLDSYT